METKYIKADTMSEETIQAAIRVDVGVVKDLYHGTEKYTAKQIIDSKKEVRCGTDCGYLGYGIYCYLHDINASKQWAKNKYKATPVAVLKIVANLGNVLFIDHEFNKILIESAKDLEKPVGDLHSKIGLLIEEIIEDHIKRLYNMDIHTVSKIYVIGKKKIGRPATMYSLRSGKRIRNCELVWEEA